jgi:hypothetical protein
MSNIANHRTVSHEEWIAERKALLAKEKEFTRLRDELSARRRDLPWEPVAKTYVFRSPHGAETLEQLFEGRSQLVIYHAMFDPKTATDKTPYTEDAACKMCSFWMDSDRCARRRPCVLAPRRGSRHASMDGAARGEAASHPDRRSLDIVADLERILGWTIPR